MSESNPHHPGVRSLLAKFEGQSPIASPPSRGRSPATSDASGTARQLSKVRASFVTVDGVIHSNPASPLRKTSGRSDSPGIFGPTINSGDVKSGRQSAVSPPPVSLDHIQSATLGQILAEGRPNTEKDEPEHVAKEKSTSAETTSRPRNTPKQDNPSTTDSKSTSSRTSLKPDSPAIVKKKPSSVGSARSVASKQSPTTASAAAKSNNTSPKLTAREVAKERSNALAHKPSRVSLTPKATARSTRGSTPAHDTTKPTAGASKAGVTSSPRPARSTTAQTSATRLASNGAPSTRTATSTSTLTRKPSSLKGATPAASVRRQSSRPSLPAQTGNDPTNKPVNEGFLARMMRPTASSANKSHPQDKPDAEPVTKTVSTSKARPSTGRVSGRGAAQVKPKSSTLRPQTQKAQASQKDSASQKDASKPSQKEQESEKEKIVESTPPSPKESATVKPTPVIALEQPEVAPEPVEVTTAPAQAEEAAPVASVASAETTKESVEVPEPIIEETVAESSANLAPVEEVAEVPAQATDSTETQDSISTEVTAPVEAAIEPSAEAANDEETAETTIATEETVAQPVATPADNELEVAKKQDTPPPKPEVQADAPEQNDVVPAVAEAAQEKSSEEIAPAAQPATEAESSNVALDIANLALN